jgi:hypothetical protein
MKDKPFPGKKKGGGKGKRNKTYLCWVTTLLGLTLEFIAFADTACARSVVGQANADLLIDFCKQRTWPFQVIIEDEPFRFGPGKRIWSSEALIIAVVWGGIVVVLKFSIVAPAVPFLVSKFVFKRIGALIDLAIAVVLDLTIITRSLVVDVACSLGADHAQGTIVDRYTMLQL